MKKTSKKIETSKSKKTQASKKKKTVKVVAKPKLKAKKEVVNKKSTKKTSVKKITPKKAVKTTKVKPKVKITKESTQKTKVSKPKEVKPTAQEIVDNSKDPEFLLGNRRHPRGWKIMSYEQKLDYIASRILAEDRHGVTSHKELKESGILSTSQYERRRNREVYSQVGDLDAVKVKRGVFNRAHVRDIRGVRNVPQQPEETTTDE